MPESFLKPVFNGVLFLISYFKKHFKPCFFILKALKDILQHIKFVNWRIRGFVVFFDVTNRLYNFLKSMYLLWFLFRLANWEKIMFWTNKKFGFFYSLLKLRKISETNWWKHLMNWLKVFGCCGWSRWGRKFPCTTTRSNGQNSTCCIKGKLSDHLKGY